jgi:GMP synthase (glutamine-hydrolysing)
VLGAPPDDVVRVHGDFVGWFLRLLAEHPVTVDVVDGTGAAPPPDPRNLAGVVMTGSPASLTAPEPWMEGAVELVREAARVGTPVLGVCFGHQVIGAAYGAGVVRNPRGRETSTHTVELTEAGRADPLFYGLPATLRVNFSHHDVVDPDGLAPKGGVRILAQNARADVQALAAGDAIRGIQFHPEFSAARVKAYIASRYADLAAEAATRNAPADHPDELLAQAQDSPDAIAVFANFMRYFVVKA